MQSHVWGKEMLSGVLALAIATVAASPHTTEFYFV